MLQLFQPNIHLVRVFWLKWAFRFVQVQIFFLEETMAELAWKIVGRILVHALPSSPGLLMTFNSPFLFSSTPKLWLKLPIRTSLSSSICLRLSLAFICKIFAVFSSLEWTWKKWRLSFAYCFPQKRQLLRLSYTRLPSFSLVATM